MTEMTGGELLLKCLKAEGATTLFGVLDGSYNAFLAKLNDYEIKYIAPRHEAAAAHIAEAWARVKGEPGIVVGGIGPGAANMISGVITAYAEGTPLIVLSGQRRRSTIYPDRGGGFQNVDLLGLYRPVTKFCAGVRDWKRLPELIRRAYREATTGRPGPVYIEIPEDIMRGKGDSDSITATMFGVPPTQSRTRVGAGDADSVARAADLLAKAERPFFHAGKGVSWSGAWKEFVELGDYLSAALGTSLGARGVVPEDHPRCFTPMNRSGLAAARSDADVVLVVGSRLGELDNWGRGATWGDPSKQKVIHLDCDPLSIGLNRSVDIGIVGDAKATLSALLAAVKQKTSQRKEHANFEKYREASKMWESQKEQALQLGMGGINSGAMIKVVRDFFPREAIHAMDGGNTSLWTSAFNAVYAPRSYLYTAHFGHLGTGLPYAIGAKIAAPDRPVYLISGDGAMGFNIQELETAARHNIPIIVVVACDKGWGMERSSQLFAQIGAMVETELYGESRYDQIAVAFGCYGEKVDQLDQLKPALERATASGKPALIQVMVDQMANMAPPGLVDFGAMVYRADD